MVDGEGLFDAEMYMTGLPGGHGHGGGGKTSSFKHYLLLRNIRQRQIADTMFAAVEARPTPHCYIHLLHGGGTGAGADVAAHATAFGHRDWDFACVVTGVRGPATKTGRRMPEQRCAGCTTSPRACCRSARSSTAPTSARTRGTPDSRPRRLALTAPVWHASSNV